MSNLPIIAGVEINTDSEGRFSLNALHKASGRGESKEPNKWLALSGTSELIAELEATEGSCGSLVNIHKGGSTPGTFAHKLLAISYAGWISPAFQLHVNQVFIDYKKQVFIDYKKSNLSPAPQTQSSAIEAAKWIHQALPHLSERNLQEMISRATRIDFGEALLPLPTVEEPFWTATELAKEFGITANKLGRIANACGLKTEEFGEYRLSKSQHSTKKIEQFHYNEKGRAALALMLAEAAEA